MDKDILSRDEDRLFTLKVIRHNREWAEGIARHEEIVEIRERVALLMYTIPRKIFFLDEDFCSDLYAMNAEEIDTIIHGFRVSRMSFNFYLTQILRYKALSALKKNKAGWLKELSLRSMRYDEEERIKGTYDDEIASDSILSYGKESPLKGLEDKKAAFEMKRLFEEISSMDLPISKRRRGGKMRDEELEDELYKLLRRPTKRRYFLFLLMKTPRSQDDEHLEDYSKVLGIDRESLERFFTCKDLLLASKDRIYQSCRERLNTSWAYLERLKTAIALEGETRNLRLLKEQLAHASRAKELNLKRLRKVKVNLTYDDISEILSTSRSAVCRGVQEMKKELNKIGSSYSEEGAESLSYEEYEI